MCRYKKQNKYLKLYDLLLANFRKQKLILLLLLGLCFLIFDAKGQQALVDYKHPIPFQPEKYICYQASTTLSIDGKLDEIDWQKAPATKDFVDIEGILKPSPSLQTYVKMLWDKEYLYIAARLEDLDIWANMTERDAPLFQEDAFEVFIDPDGDGHQYYELEINARNTVWDLILLKPYRIDLSPKSLSNWEIKGLKSAVHIEGTLNVSTDKDAYWTIEIAFPWSVLKELSPLPAPPQNVNQWRINFSRVDWLLDAKDGQYEKRIDLKESKSLAENIWVWSPQGRRSMHHPETWGYVQFATEKVGTEEAVFKDYPEERIKWALWQLHFQQAKYLKKYKKYSSNLQELTKVTVELPNYIFQPVLENYTGGYQLLAKDLEGKKYWIINEQGRFRKEK